LRSEADRLRQSFNIASNNKNLLLDELNALNAHIDTISLANNDMNLEIDDIIKRDEMIRSEIAMRQSRAANIRATNEDQFWKSMTYLQDKQARSPIRKR